MTIERAAEFQKRITKEAIALMVIHGESAANAGHAEDTSVARFEEAVTWIGMAWGLPADMTLENLTLIQLEKAVLRDMASGKDVVHVLPERDLPMNATGMETLDNVWDLFETAIRLDSQERRAALFALASELAECQNLLDWIEKTPAERELPEVAIG